jgi:hypothetical protein
MCATVARAGRVRMGRAASERTHLTSTTYVGRAPVLVMRLAVQLHTRQSKAVLVRPKADRAISTLAVLCMLLMCWKSAEHEQTEILILTCSVTTQRTTETATRIAHSVPYSFLFVNFCLLVPLHHIAIINYYCGIGKGISSGGLCCCYLSAGVGAACKAHV